MNHPAHLAIDRLGLSLVDTFVPFDITDDADPEVTAKNGAIHQRRSEAHPDIADLASRVPECTAAARGLTTREVSRTDPRAGHLTHPYAPGCATDPRGLPAYTGGTTWA